MKFNLVATCIFGLESVLGEEIRKIGAEDVVVDNGRVFFSGDDNLLATANITLSTAERVLIVAGRFNAYTFDDLFEGVAAINWADYIGIDDEFPVKGYSINSKLASIPDCQRIMKRAVVKSLERSYHKSIFEETGVKLQLSFGILKDEACIMIDSSGYPLHKRGYRKQSVIAPIKETLAAGIIRLSRLSTNGKLYDPFCGSGTLLIEGSYKALRIAPGIARPFAAERYGFIDKNAFKEAKQQAYAAVIKDSEFSGVGFDIDPEAIDLSIANIKKAGVAGKIRVEEGDFNDFTLSDEGGLIVCNPPYGERISDKDSARELYKKMGQTFQPNSGFKYSIISSDEEFEQYFGRKADKKRKLYNGMMRCNLFMYFK